LALPIQYTHEASSAYGPDEGEFDEENEEQTEENLEKIAEALEARQKLGITGLKKLGRGDWLEHGTIEVRLRLLRVLLPYLESIPGKLSYNYWDTEDFDDPAAVFDEVGAPGLKSFYFCVASSALVTALQSMTSLTELAFAQHSIDKSWTDRFIDLLVQYGSNLLPQLEVLDMRNAFKSAKSAQRFFHSAGLHAAFASVKELRLGKGSWSRNPSPPLVSFCPSAVFSQGAFAGIERLILRGMKLAPNSLTALCQALEHSPCVKNLTKLDLQECDISGSEMLALGGLCASSLLSSLQELNLDDNPLIKSAGLVHLVDGIKEAGAHAAPALKKLTLANTGIGPVGLSYLMSAVVMACFPALEELKLSHNARLTDGFECLSETMETGHLSKLRSLALYETGLKSSDETSALATAILMHCPEMTTLSLPKELGDDVKQAVRVILQGKKDLSISFWQYG
jgi:hypothetical protein